MLSVISHLIYFGNAPLLLVIRKRYSLFQFSTKCSFHVSMSVKDMATVAAVVVVVAMAVAVAAVAIMKTIAAVKSAEAAAMLTA